MKDQDRQGLQLKCAALLFLLFAGGFCHAQQKKDSLLADTAFLDYDEFFSELDALLDSLNTPRSFTLIGVSAGSNDFTYTTESGIATTKRQLTFSPSLGYFGKSGFGISAEALLVNDQGSFAPFQYSASVSYDYLKTKKLITGLSLTRYFTKPDLPFYTAPLQTELYGYVTLRKHWLKPSVTASYGWGKRETYAEPFVSVENSLPAGNSFTWTNTSEQIVDINVTASVRHDFYFLNTLFRHDFVRLTPQLGFTGGTQQFGFSQTSNAFAKQPIPERRIVYKPEDMNLDNNLSFQPLSFTADLKAAYTDGKFFFQPQIIFDDDFTTTRNKYTTAYLINAGFVF